MAQRADSAATCRICAGAVEEFVDFGRQPVSDSFVTPERAGSEYFFRLAAGVCTACSMVQLTEEVPRTEMFHDDYPYRSSGSEVMRRHFTAVAESFLAGPLRKADPFVLEIGSNDGIMLRTVKDAGVRHLGVDPSVGAAKIAAEQGIRVATEFFEEDFARRVAEEEGRADVVFSANTFSHIAYIDSIFRGIDAVLADDGVFVFEDRYLGDIVRRTLFDQIYDEHYYIFGVTSVRAMAAHFGFELVDAEHLDVHGGSMRYTVMRPGRRPVAERVTAALAEERTLGLDDPAVYRRFAATARTACADLRALLERLKAEGRTVAGYGATAKSSTVLNYAGIGPDLLPAVHDSTDAKQGRLTPGTHIPVRSPEEFRSAYPDYAVLFAWNHAAEIFAKEQGFREAGGRWILYVPGVHIR
ncbi:class I SAM-dependent methyltransferase [Streptomonospora sp. S1-112]|uniref:Class I SAM-dependent methyltransferase n=1 Tax=Streptomonospora mangrovi TaxID=2883123 RepID=A0A9X3NTL1_9ACTN|nr:class I SAM-dependent methyltransferase [Streptomonospora mangrovi]MDA0567774.1 class I SAM-dependent methyltransferase [Streptomonospora mangrovi]